MPVQPDIFPDIATANNLVQALQEGRVDHLDAFLDHPDAHCVKQGRLIAGLIRCTRPDTIDSLTVERTEKVLDILGKAYNHVFSGKMDHFALGDRRCDARQQLKECLSFPAKLAFKTTDIKLRDTLVERLDLIALGLAAYRDDDKKLGQIADKRQKMLERAIRQRQNFQELQLRRPRRRVTAKPDELSKA